MTIVNDATSWSPTLESSITFLESSISHHLCSQRTFIVQASLMIIVNYNHHIFIVQATVVSSNAVRQSVFEGVSFSKNFRKLPVIYRPIKFYYSGPSFLTMEEPGLGSLVHMVLMQATDLVTGACTIKLFTFVLYTVMQ